MQDQSNVRTIQFNNKGGIQSVETDNSKLKTSLSKVDLSEFRVMGLTLLQLMLLLAVIGIVLAILL